MDTPDPARVEQFVGQVIGDLGGANSVPTVRLGFRLGLFDTLAREGPLDAEGLAAAAGDLAPRYVREWALAQAANGYIMFDPGSGRFHMTPEQALVFAVPDSPVYLEGAFDLVAEMLLRQDKVEACFRHGGGVDWGDSAGCLFCAVGTFFRPGYVNNLVPAWLPALDGVVPRLEAGAQVADLGCGVGFSTLLMAEAYPASRFVGYDFHGPSIDEARRHAEAHGVADRVRFEVAEAQAITDTGFDLVTCFDCLHDMGDPTGCATAVRRMLADDGTWMVVEPLAGERPEDNLHPVGRLFYNASTMICVPTSLAQPGAAGLGAQAGEAVLGDVIRAGGFASVRRATAGPFNMVLEARP